MKYLTTVDNFITFTNDQRVRKIWEYGSDTNHNISILLADGERKDFNDYADRNKMLQEADDYLILVNI